MQGKSCALPVVIAVFCTAVVARVASYSLEELLDLAHGQRALQQDQDGTIPVNIADFKSLLWNDNGDSITVPERQASTGTVGIPVSEEAEQSGSAVQRGAYNLEPWQVSHLSDIIASSLVCYPVNILPHVCVYIRTHCVYIRTHWIVSPYAYAYLCSPPSAQKQKT